MNKTIQVFIALAALAAVFVVPSVASASPELTSPTGTKAPVGTGIQLISVAHAQTPTRLIYTTSGGISQCESGVTMTGEVSSNTGTDIAINISTVSIGCPTNVTITPNHTNNPVHNGVTSLPWCLTANGLEDLVSIRGGACSEAARPLTVSMHTALGICNYENASLTAPYTTHPSATIATVATQQFSKNTGGGFCPSAVAWDFAFTLKTDTKIPEDVYIK